MFYHLIFVKYETSSRFKIGISMRQYLKYKIAASSLCLVEYKQYLRSYL